MAAPFAYELGVFDPTYPGVTLHYPTEATWQRACDVEELYAEFGARDFVEQHRLPSGDLPGEEQLHELIIQNPQVGLTLSPEAKEALGHKLIASDPENAVANLAIGSAFEHERRHFHDWLLSPYTAAINAIRTEVFVNSRELRLFLESDEVTVIPVPLPLWLRKSNAEQDTLVGMWRSLLGDSVPIRLPDLRDPAIAPAVEAIRRRYGSIGILFQPMASIKLDAAAIFEASALMVQIQAIHDLLGDSASNLFADAMANLALPSRYGWFLQAMGGLAREGEILKNNIVSTIATWCLLGNTTADRANAHPLVRMSHATACVKARGFRWLDKPAASILEELDRSSGAVPYRDLLKHSMKLGDTVVQQLTRIATTEGSRSSFLLGLSQTYELLQEYHVHMARFFMEAPELYCHPDQYLDEAIGYLPEPPRRETFGRPFRSVTPAQLGRYARVRLFRDASTDDQPVVREIVEEVLPGTIDLQVADNWQYLCGLADTVFAEHNRDSPEIEAHKLVAKESGLRYMEVLA